LNISTRLQRKLENNTSKVIIVSVPAKPKYFCEIAEKPPQQHFEGNTTLSALITL
jgi:hypothetical protein